MREDEVVVGELDPEHGAGEDGNDFSLELDCFFGIHSVCKTGALGRAPVRVIQIAG